MADRFTADKLAWIEQVNTDGMLSPIARVVASVIATKYLNRETGDAWPATETLAADVGRGRTQVRAALQALAERGHLEITTTVGGKNQTNRYRPILKPSGNPKGMETSKRGVNPSDFRRDTLRISDIKPSGNPKGNPIEEPYEEHKGGLQPPTESRSTLDGSRGSHLDGAPPTSSPADESDLVFRVGAWRRNLQGESYEVVAVDEDARTVTVRFENGRQGAVAAPAGAVLISQPDEIDDEVPA